MLYTQGKYVISTFDYSFFGFFTGGFKDFTLVERLGEGKLLAAVIREVADDMGLDLVVFNMESIHSKHVDNNLWAKFVPCHVLLFLF
jgi:hypothetical protein